jgi:hypothetical protein
MQITIETGSYNERRYGKPWIAKVEFDASGNTSFSFGNWVGSPGYEGELVIDAERGDIVARGQKDHRKGNGYTTYYIVDENGDLDEVGSKGSAYKAWKAEQARRLEEAAAATAETPAPTREELEAERSALLARLAEINKALGEPNWQQIDKEIDELLEQDKEALTEPPPRIAKAARAAALAAAQMALIPGLTATVGSQMNLF